MTEIHNKLFDTKLLSYDESTGKYAWVSPKLLTSTIYNKDGVNLDDLLSVTPAELTKMVEGILKGAPEAYDTFLEVSKDLEDNKDSITEIFREIDKRIKEPEGKVAGYVLKLDDDLNYVFAKDENTTYDLSPYAMLKDLKDYALKSDIKDVDLSGYAKKTDIPKLPDMGKYAQIDSSGKLYLDQLPPEALKDTTYDLTPYALKDDVAKTFALKSELPVIDLSPYVKTTALKDYAKKTDLNAYQKTIQCGAVNGYASLDNSGKVPKEQLPDIAGDIDLSSYALKTDISDMATTADVANAKLSYMAENTANKGKANGYASLDSNGLVPSSQLPSYVDDVLEYADKSMFPATGEAGKIYTALDSNSIYRWSGSSYVEINPSLVTKADMDRWDNKQDRLGDTITLGNYKIYYNAKTDTLDVEYVG